MGLQFNESPAVVGATGGSGGNRLLAQLPAEDIVPFAKHLKTVPLIAGEILHEVGEPIDQVYFPHSGFVSLVTVLKSGQAIENAMVGRDGAVGTKSAFGCKIALTRSVVQGTGAAQRIASAPFIEFVHRSAALRRLVAQFNERLVAQIQQNAACYAAHTLEARLCRWLLTAAGYGDGQTVRMTQDCLAQTIGVHRGRLNTVLRTLQRRGLLYYHQRGAIHLDRAAIEAGACECHDVIRDLQTFPE